MANPQANAYAQRLQQQGASLSQAASLIVQQFSGINAVDTTTALVGAYNLTIDSTPALAGALTAATYTPADTAAGLQSVFPNLNARHMTTALLAAHDGALTSLGYGLVLSGSNTYVAMPNNPAYNFGQSDFSVAAWIRPQKSAGQIITRKAAGGGPGNGGWLFVMYADATFKLATDDGFGYYEIITDPTTIFDGGWHYVAAVRQGGTLSAYIDGQRIRATVGTNRNQSPLNVNNNLRLVVGYGDQQQESAKFFNGQITHVALWRTARSAADLMTTMAHGVNTGDPNLVGYWTYAGQSAQDLSLVSNNGAFTGHTTFTAPTYLPPAFPLALALNNISTPVTITHQDAYNVAAGDFSLEAWFNTTVGGTLVSYGSADNASDTGFALVIDALNGEAKLFVAGGGQQASATAATTAADSQWHVLTAVRSSGTIDLSLDGVPLAVTTQGNAAATIQSRVPLVLGGAVSGSVFVGAINDVRFWTRALSRAELLASRVQLVPSVAQNLVGMWVFRSDGVKDRSPLANHGSYGANVSFIPPTALPATPLANDSLWLDPRTGGVAEIPLPVPMTLNDFTVEAWVNTSDAHSGTSVFNCDGAFGFSVVNGAMVFTEDKGRDFVEWKARAQPADGRWHHVAAVRQKDVVHMYLDGNAVNTLRAGQVTGPLTCNGRITVGGLQPDNYNNRYNGLLDELRLWNVARSQQDLQRTMNSALIPQQQPDLLLYHNFDDGTGRELTGKGAALTLYGSAMIIQSDIPVSLTVVAPPQPYPAPQNLIAAYMLDNGAGRLVVRWSAVQGQGVTGYTVELQANTTPGIYSTPATSYTLDQTLDATTSYTVRVKAQGAHDGLWSPPLSLVLQAPSNITADAATLNPLTVGWQSIGVSSAVYTVELRPSGENPVDRATAAGADSYTFNDYNLDMGHMYTVQVRAQSGAATGPWSAAVPVLVTAPQQITTAATSLSAFRVNWQPESSLAYNVRLTPSSGNVQTYPVAQGVGHYAYTGDALNPALHYTVQVQAVSGGSFGPWSAFVPLLLDVPTQLQVEVAIVQTQNRLRATWQPLADTTLQYNVMLVPRQGAPETVALPANTSSYTFTQVDLVSGMTYSVAVAAFAHSAQGMWSDPVHAPMLRSATYTYDRLGRLTSATYAGFATYAYAYDNAGNMTQITQQEN